MDYIKKTGYFSSYIDCPMKKVLHMDEDNGKRPGTIQIQVLKILYRYGILTNAQLVGLYMTEQKYGRCAQRKNIRQALKNLVTQGYVIQLEVVKYREKQDYGDEPTSIHLYALSKRGIDFSAQWDSLYYKKFNDLLLECICTHDTLPLGIVNFLIYNEFFKDVCIVYTRAQIRTFLKTEHLHLEKESEGMVIPGSIRVYHRRRLGNGQIYGEKYKKYVVVFPWIADGETIEESCIAYLRYHKVITNYVAKERIKHYMIVSIMFNELNGIAFAEHLKQMAENEIAMPFMVNEDALLYRPLENLYVVTDGIVRYFSF